VDTRPEAGFGSLKTLGGGVRSNKGHTRDGFRELHCQNKKRSQGLNK